MKKLMTIAGAVCLMLAVVASTAVAHGSHGKSRAQIWRATLAPVTAPVPMSADAGATGSTGEVASPTSGRAQVVENKRRYNGWVFVRGLTPSTSYTVSVFENADGTGCASTTNTAVSTTAFKPLVTSDAGKGAIKFHGKSADLPLDSTKSYYVSVLDASGNGVCGDLKTKSKKHQGKGKSHGSHGKSEGKAKGHS